MQFLVFHLGDDRYGLSTRRVIRVLPLMELKHIPQAPSHVAGLMNMRGETIPVIDLCMLATGKACTRHFDTRIVLADYDARRRIGIIVERVAGIEYHDEAAFAGSGVAHHDAPYLGKVTADDGTVLQLVEIDHLLTDEVRAILYPDAAKP